MAENHPILPMLINARLSRIALFPKGFHQSATMINYAR
jgi:hypothetical protein